MMKPTQESSPPELKLPEPEKFQTVLIYFSNGTIGSFTGKPIASPENAEKEKLSITDIKFLPPQALPEGCVFELMEESENELDLPEVIAGETSEEKTE